MKYLKTYEQNNGITFKKWLEYTFKEWLKYYPQDINSTSIDCTNSNLIDLNGIEQFKNLKYLVCYNNKLTQLPDLSQNLKLLDCSNNQLIQLPDLSQCENLKKLYCSNNQLTQLPDLTQCKNLKNLDCSNNQLNQLPNLSQNLKLLDCSNNQLPYDNLGEYIEWHKKIYPWIWDAKKYNI